MSALSVYAFITDWEKIHPNVADLKSIIEPYVNEVTVLDNPDHYFSEQWNTMLGNIRDGLVLWIMGDVTLPPEFWNMHGKYLEIMQRGDVGVYSPNVDYTFHNWDVKGFNEIQPSVYEVPCAEPNCWLIRSDVLKNTSPVDVVKNKYGWGVDLMVSSTAELMGLKTVRDYRFKAGHPNFTGYDEVEAESQMQSWEEGLTPELREVMKRRWEFGLKYNINWKKRQWKKRRVFSSSTTGDMSLFFSGLKEREGSISVTFDDGFNFEDDADFKVHMQIEPPEVINVKDKLIENHKFYDLILTWDEDVIKACPNARLFPQALCTWIDQCYYSNTWNPKI